jgi:hypothetical protein
MWTSPAESCRRWRTTRTNSRRRSGRPTAGCRSGRTWWACSTRRHRPRPRRGSDRDVAAAGDRPDLRPGHRLRRHPIPAPQPPRGPRHRPGRHRAEPGPGCRRDHRLKHQAGWHVRRNPNGTTIWTSPQGREYTNHPPGALEDTRRIAAARSGLRCGWPTRRQPASTAPT